MEARETSFNDMQTVKRVFFALRNGVISEVLRRNGSPFRIIFGLNLPQIADVAAHTPRSQELAEKLWSNSTTRESMLIAPMLVDIDAFKIEDARRWVAGIPAREVADVLCLKLLKHEHYALELARELQHAETVLARYTGLRLMFNLHTANTADALSYSQAVQAFETDSVNLALARSLQQECEYILEGC